MNKTTALAIFLTIIGLTRPIRTTTEPVAVYFSPRGGTGAAIAAQLDGATTSIDVAAYILSYKPLAERIIAAHHRGVKVRVIVDRVQEVEPAPIPQLVKAAGIETRTDRGEKLFHSKYAVVDSRVVATGSYNWSNNAELENAENLLILHDPDVAARFAADFNAHWLHSRPYMARRPNPNRTKIRQPKPFRTTTAQPGSFSNPLQPALQRT
jgi:phosphatidylserine/phosphatidylglycerophosphate/cardiolipin synthase-like enzyme